MNIDVKIVFPGTEDPDALSRKIAEAFQSIKYPLDAWAMQPRIAHVGARWLVFNKFNALVADCITETAALAVKRLLEA